MYKKIYCSKVWKDIYWNHWNKACVCWSVYVFLGNAGLKREKKPFLNNCFTFCLGKIRPFWSIIWKIYINFTSVVLKNNINLNVWIFDWEVSEATLKNSANSSCRIMRTWEIQDYFKKIKYLSLSINGSKPFRCIIIDTYYRGYWQWC